MAAQTKHYFTFGMGQPLNGYVQVIYSDDPEDAREKMVNTHGSQWAFQYTESEWQQSREDGYFSSIRSLDPIHCNKKPTDGNQ